MIVPSYHDPGAEFRSIMLCSSRNSRPRARGLELLGEASDVTQVATDFVCLSSLICSLSCCWSMYVRWIFLASILWRSVDLSELRFGRRRWVKDDFEVQGTTGYPWPYRLIWASISACWLSTISFYCYRVLIPRLDSYDYFGSKQMVVQS